MLSIFVSLPSLASQIKCTNNGPQTLGKVVMELDPEGSYYNGVLKFSGRTFVELRSDILRRLHADCGPVSSMEYGFGFECRVDAHVSLEQMTASIDGMFGKPVLTLNPENNGLKMITIMNINGKTVVQDWFFNNCERL